MAFSPNSRICNLATLPQEQPNSDSKNPSENPSPKQLPRALLLQDHTDKSYTMSAHAVAAAIFGSALLQPQMESQESKDKMAKAKGFKKGTLQLNNRHYEKYCTNQPPG